MQVSTAADVAHSLPTSELVTLLGSDAAAGIGSSTAGDRLDAYGRNELPGAPRSRPLAILVRQFTSVLVVILLIAAALSLAIWIAQREESFPFDTIVILAIVVANALLGFFQEYRAEQSLEKLQALAGPRATVIRRGDQMEIAASELVPGDLLVLTTGARVLGDARLVSLNSLRVDESTLTGESTAVHKQVEPVDEEAEVADRASMVYAGTTIASGRGLAVVTATGSTTEIGKIAELILATEHPATPLQMSLNQLGRRLGLLIVIISVVVAATGLFVTGKPDVNHAVDMLLFGIALAVFAIPEGLPAVMTGALALGTQRMARRNAIVRQLPAVETLGSTTAICSDKTGTLTVGEMTVRQLLLPTGKVVFAGGGYEPVGDVTGSREAVDAAPALAMSAVLCNDASIRRGDRGHWLAVGTPTEASLLTMAVKLGIDYSFIRQQSQRVAEAPFSSERKMMSVVASAGGGGRVMHAKGAPEVILPLCTRAMTSEGIREMGEGDRERFLSAAAVMAGEALRTLAVATRVLEPGACDDPASCEHDLVFLGIAGIADPPRPEAARSVAKCRRAGIEVFMVTGDHLTTAQAIAGELGIGGSAVSGREMDQLDDAALAELLGSGHRIFARVSPAHKVRLVEALQSLGHVVAVTGDGVNDAPALKRADIGVAMGRAGTDVAREAADMVLADDNFATIVAAVEEGRSIFSNIRKFVAYLLSSNTGGMVTLFLGVLLSGWLGFRDQGNLVLPLLVGQILWINLVTNGLPALALGVEPKHPAAMSQPPRRRSEAIVHRRVWEFIGLVGLVSGFGTLFMLESYFPGGLFTLSAGHDIDYARTVAFVTMASFQLFNVFNCRRMFHSSLKRFFSNSWLMLAVAVSLGMMIAVVYVPGLQTAFHTESLALWDWLAALAVASSVLWVVELFKLITRRRRELV